MLQILKHTKTLSLIFIGLSLGILWLFPEADYPWWKDLSDAHDEFWWAENARRKILFNEWFWDDYAAGIASGPLSTVWHYCSFKTFGIHFFSLRLVALLPALMSIILLLKCTVFKQSSRPEHVFILVSSSFFFVFGRIGYLEMMLFFISLAYLVLQSSNNAFKNVMAGILLTTGLLFKGSFIYLLVPLFIFSFLSNKNKKQKGMILFSTIISSSLVYLFYYYPNQADFSKYIQFFNTQNIPVNHLLNPLGWIPRIAWLPYKESFSSPFTLFIFFALFIKLSNAKAPQFRNSIWGLIILILSVSLLSDFSDRRLVFILFFLPLCLGEKFDKPLNGAAVYIMSIFLCLPLITLFVEGQFEPAELIIKTLIPFAVFIFIISVIIKTLSLLFQKKWKKIVITASCLIWLSFLLFNSSKVWLGVVPVHFLGIHGILLLGCLIIFLVSNASLKTHQAKYFAPFIIGLIQVIFLLFSEAKPIYSLRNEADSIAKLIQEPMNVYAENPSLSICFLSKARIPFEIESINLNQNPNFSFAILMNWLNKSNLSVAHVKTKKVKDTVILTNHSKKPVEVKVWKINSISSE